MTSDISPSVAPDNRGLRRRLVTGFAAQGLTFFATLAQQFLLVPLFLAQWGTSVYAEWLILVAAADFLRLAEFALQYPLANAMRMAWARGETAAFTRTLSIGFSLYAALLMVAVPVVLIVIFAIGPAIFAQTAMPSALATWSVAFLAFTTLIMLPRNLVIAVYAARGDFSRGETLSALYVLSQSLFVAVALVLGAQPWVVAVIYSANALVVGLGAVFVDQRRRYGGRTPVPAIPTRSEVGTLLRKARHYVVPDIAEIAMARAPVLILGALAPQDAVVLFTVSRIYTGVVRQIVTQIARVTGIEMARQHAQDDVGGRRRLFMNAGRLIGAAIGILGGMALAVSAPFIRFWTHGQVTYDSAVVVMLLGSLFFSGPGQAGALALQFMNQPRPLALAAVIQAGGAVVLALFLVPHYGALGAAVAVAVAEVAAFGVYIVVVATRDVGVWAGTYVLQADGLAIVLFAATYLAVRPMFA